MEIICFYLVLAIAVLCLIVEHYRGRAAGLATHNYDLQFGKYGSHLTAIDHLGVQTLQIRR